MVTVTQVARARFDTDPFFPLEPGPLTPLDPGALDVRLPPGQFTNLVGDLVSSIEGQHARIDAGHQTITDNSVPTRIVAASASELEPAGASHAAIVGTVGQADPSEVIDLTHAQVPVVDANSGYYDDDGPGHITVPTVPDKPIKLTDEQTKDFLSR